MISDEDADIFLSEIHELSEKDQASERLIYNVTEDILLAMQDCGVSQANLAKSLGKTPAYISSLLNGSRNMTLKTLSDINFALDTKLKVCILRNGVDVSLPIVPPMESSKFNVDSSVSANYGPGIISVNIVMRNEKVSFC